MSNLSKRFVSLAMIFTMMLAMYVPVYAEDINTLSESQQDAIDMLFEHNYTILSISGEDISSYFYETYESAYLRGDYATIQRYLYNSASRAFYEETCANTPNARARYEDFTKYYFEQVYVDDINHGWDEHNTLIYYAEGEYTVDNMTGEIVEAEDPTIYDITLVYHYGELEPVFDTSERSAEIASNGLSVTFRIDIFAGLVFQGGDYESGIMNGDCFIYYHEAEFVAYAP